MIRSSLFYNFSLSMGFFLFLISHFYVLYYVNYHRICLGPLLCICCDVFAAFVVVLPLRFADLVPSAVFVVLLPPSPPPSPILLQILLVPFLPRQTQLLLLLPSPPPSCNSRCFPSLTLWRYSINAFISVIREPKIGREFLICKNQPK